MAFITHKYIFHPSNNIKSNVSRSGTHKVMSSLICNANKEVYAQYHESQGRNSQSHIGGGTAVGLSVLSLLSHLTLYIHSQCQLRAINVSLVCCDLKHVKLTTTLLIMSKTSRAFFQRHYGCQLLKFLCCSFLATTTKYSNVIP